MAFTCTLLALSLAAPASSAPNVWTLGQNTAQTCNDVCFASDGKTCVGMAWPSTSRIMEDVANTMEPNPCASYHPAADRHTTVAGNAPYVDAAGDCFFYPQGSCAATKTAADRSLLCPCLLVPQSHRGHLNNDGTLKQQAFDWLASGNDLESLPPRGADADALGAQAARESVFGKFELQHVSLPRTVGGLVQVAGAASVALAALMLAALFLASALRQRQRRVASAGLLSEAPAAE